MWQITLFALAEAAYMVMDFYVPIKYVLPTFENTRVQKIIQY